MIIDPDAKCFPDESDSDDDSSQSDESTDSEDSIGSSDSDSWGDGDSLQAYSLEDDEEDLRRVRRPCTLRDCLAYLLTAENDDLAYDKIRAVLAELPTIVTSHPLDLLDVAATLVRVLLFLEDKFSMDQFDSMRWNSLMTIGVHAPLETTILLVEQMRGNISLGTRLEALSIISGVAQDLSGVGRGPQQKPGPTICNDAEVTSCSSRLQRVLNLRDGANEKESAKDSSAHILSKTRRWRKPRTSPSTTTNRFGPVAVQMIYSLFAFLSETRTDELIWDGPMGERFLSEFLKSLSTMLYCASTYPNPALRVLATDLFDLAWSFRDAKCAEVRQAALVAMATCMSMVPIEFVMRRSSDLSQYLKNRSVLDEDAECRSLAALVAGSISEVMQHNMITERV